MQIKNIASARASYPSDSNKFVRILRKTKAKTGVLRSNKSPKRAHSRHHGIQRYGVLWMKAVIPERKYTSHSSKDCTGVRTNRSIKDVLGGPMGIRSLKTNVRRSWKLSGIRTRCYIAFPRNLSRAMNSRRSGQKLLRRVATFTVVIRTLMYC